MTGRPPRARAGTLATRNLVLYDSSLNVLWSSETYGTDLNIASMQGDGNFVIYEANWNVPWAANTNGNEVVIYSANNGPAIKSIRYECNPQCS